MTSIAPTHRVSFSIGDEHAAKRVVDVLTEIFFEGEAAVAAFERPDGRWDVTVHFADPPDQAQLRELVTNAASAEIAGTLPFDTIDLRSFLAAFSALTPDATGTYRTVDPNAGNQMALDLRLSASRATAGTFSLNNVAATAQVKGGLAAFDISDAKAFGGSLQFGLRVDRKWEGTAVELRLVAENIDGAAAAEKLGWPFLPHARGSSSIIIKGTGARWEEVFSNAEGSITASFGKGEIPGIDLKTLRARSAKGGFFPLSGVESSALPIDKAELKATVVNGVARIDHARATSDTTRVTVGGLVPLAGGGLALSGWIAPTDPKQANAGAGGVPKLAFFIGGSWSSPFFSPVLPGLPPG